MAIQQVAVVSVPVSDPARAKAFHVDVLGLDLVHEDDSVPGLHWIQVAPRDGTTALTLVTWFESMPAGSLRGLVLRSPDLTSDYEALVAKGVEFDARTAFTRVDRTIMGVPPRFLKGIGAAICRTMGRPLHHWQPMARERDIRGRRACPRCGCPGCIGQAAQPVTSLAFGICRAIEEKP